MKKQILLAAALVIYGITQAQDYIILKSGDEIKAKIFEIGTTEVKYKKWENQSGPLYNTSKSDIFMVKYENGSKDIFKDEAPKPVYNQNGAAGTTKPMTEEDVKRNYEAKLKAEEAQKNYVEYESKFKKKLTSGIVSTAIAGGFVVIGIPCLAYGVTRLRIGGQYDEGAGYVGSIALIALGGGMLVSSIPLFITGPKKIIQGIKYKKAANETKRNLSMYLEPNVGSMIDYTTGNQRAHAGLALKLNF